MSELGAWRQAGAGATLHSASTSPTSAQRRREQASHDVYEMSKAIKRRLELRQKGARAARAAAAAGHVAIASARTTGRRRGVPRAR